MDTRQQFLLNLQQLNARIETGCAASGRNPAEVRLMAVTKTHPAPVVRIALEEGLTLIGENRVQEAAEKRPQAGLAEGFWELIGPLQTNKARQAVKTFDRIQTVDRLKLVHQLDRICGEEGKRPYPVLMQVNVGEDPSKSGCLKEQAPELAAAIMNSQNLRLEGLMTIGEFSDQESVVRPTFERLRRLRDDLVTMLGCPLPELSMGMSDDLEWAIGEGSTLIRVGTALFGQR